MVAGKKLNILFAASEVAPFIKTGGLADVASTLPRTLSEFGHNVIVALPLYGSISLEGLKKTGIIIKIAMGGKKYSSTVYEGRLGAGTKVYFFRQRTLYGRPNPYGNGNVDYPDNDARFIFFNRAVFELAKKLDFRPDVIHANDWQCGLMPVYLQNTKDKFFKDTASVFSIHNLAYQGFFPKESMDLTGLPAGLFTSGKMEIHGFMGMLKSGVVFADAVTAVSPTYAREILTSSLGFGMEGVLKARRKSLYGILNGIDVKEWNPSTDRYIPARYRRKNLSGKAKCRQKLLKDAGLDNDLKKPLIGIVSRLIEQKGFDIVAAAVEKMFKEDFYLIAIGTGQPEYEKLLLGLKKKFPGRVGVKIGYDNGMAHRITAASDLFLMPSRFEPCGLNQMYSLRYGTIPLVRATGGLNDTINNWNAKDKSGNGFVFKSPGPEALARTFKRAVRTFADKRQWARLMDNAMSEEFSWKKSAKLYLQLYKKVLL